MPVVYSICCSRLSYIILLCRPAAKPNAPPAKKGKEGRKWDLGGNSRDAAALDVFNTAEDKDKVNVTASEVCSHLHFFNVNISV